MATKEYKGDGFTIVWDSEKCIHSAVCVKGLPTVFQPRDRPWIKIDAEDADKIIAQVKACPSGAISIKEE